LLNELGVPATTNRYDGMIHGFFSMVGVVDPARDAMNDACKFLRGAVDDMTEEYFQQHEGDPMAMRKLLDPQAAHVLELFDSLGIKPFQEMDVDECREIMNSRPRPEGPAVGNVEDRIIQNMHGKEPGEVPIRIYTPATTGPWGTLVWYHGGGWVIGNVETADATARELCVGGNCVVVSVDYRLAPEYKFPTPFEDCLTATMWAMANAEALGSRPDAIAVGGDSAGGNLAAAVSLAQDDFPHELAFQLLVYPATDFAYNTRSYEVNGRGMFLETASMRWFWDHYCNNTDLSGYNIFASPLRARLSNKLPPALVITAEFDPLRDEGEAYATALEEAGVATNLIRYDGVIHGFFGMPHVIDKGRQAVDTACANLREAFGTVMEQPEAMAAADN
jgi:acetyl esterase